MNRRFWRKIGLIAAVLVISGLIRLPYQNNLLKRMQAAGFNQEPEGPSVIGRLGVESAIGALGGLRYLIAAGFQLETVDLWEAHRWNELDEKYRLISLLQVDDGESWRLWAWHMAYNANAWYKLDEKEMPREIREAMASHYIERGKSILAEAIQWNPNDYLMYRDLANIFKEKDEDFCAAADVFRAGAQVEGAPSFMGRFYGYMIAKCPGREEEAYAVLKSMYDHGFELLSRAKARGASRDVMHDGIRTVWKPTLITSLRELEEKLGVAEADRILERFDSDRFRIISPFRVEKEPNEADR